MRLFISLIFLSIILGCETPKKLPEREISTSPYDQSYFEIEYDSLIQLDENGYPAEMVNYIPLDLVQGLSLRYVKHLPPYESEFDLDSIPWFKIKSYKEVVADTILVKSLSKLLYNNQEPLLFDHYLGQEMYRLIWSPSFHDQVVIRIVLEEKACHLIGYQIGFDNSIVKKIEKELTIREFQEFQELVLETNYWAHEPYSSNHGEDGSQWTIEAHTKSNYGFLTRWNPQLVREDEFTLRLLGQWLIQKAELDHLQIY